MLTQTVMVSWKFLNASLANAFCRLVNDTPITCSKFSLGEINSKLSLFALWQSQTVNISALKQSTHSKTDHCQFQQITEVTYYVIVLQPQKEVPSRASWIVSKKPSLPWNPGAELMFGPCVTCCSDVQQPTFLISRFCLHGVNLRSVSLLFFFENTSNKNCLNFSCRLFLQF